MQEKIAQETGLKKAMMLDAIKVGKIHNIDYLRKGKTPPLMNQLKYKFYEKTVYALLKKTIGIENGNFSLLLELPYLMKSVNLFIR